MLWSAAVLPERVPLHFGADLRADRMGSRAEAVQLESIIGGLVAGLFAGLLVVARRGSLRLVNIPHKGYWTAAERRPRLRQMLATDVAAVGSATLLMLAILQVLTVQAARADPVALAPVFGIVLALYVASLLGWTVWLYRSRYRPPA